jgi:2-oxoglutarate ferredoxin oxidoreductase subunit beta
MAAGKCGVQPKDLLVVSGIGCSSNLPGFIKAYGIHSLHGRSVPVATGAHLANTGVKTVITGGDGDGYGIGVGHFIHAMRRNLDVTYIVMDNQIYGLTTGQASPTTTRGHKTKSTPKGNAEIPLNPLALAITAGATYVARGFSGEQKQLVDLIAGGIAHKGFALIDVFSPCVTYNKVNTYPWFKERVYKLEDENWDPSNAMKSIEKSFEWNEKIPLGVLFKSEQVTYEDVEPVLQRGPLVKQKLGLSAETMKSFVDEMI